MDRRPSQHDDCCCHIGALESPDVRKRGCLLVGVGEDVEVGYPSPAQHCASSAEPSRAQAAVVYTRVETAQLLGVPTKRADKIFDSITRKTSGLLAAIEDGSW